MCRCFSQCVFFLCVSISFFCEAQNKFQNSSFETGVYSGRVVKNYPSFPDRDKSLVFNGSYYKKLNGNKSWHRYYHYPEVTLQAWYGDLGNKKILGNITGITSGFRYTQSLSNRFTLS